MYIKTEALYKEVHDKSTYSLSVDPLLPEVQGYLKGFEISPV